MYTLRKSSFTLVRQPTPRTYGAFTQMVDVSGNPMTIAVPKNGGICLHRYSFTLDWVVTATPVNFRLRLIDSDPVPPLVVTDNVDGGSFSLAAYYDSLTTVGNLDAVPLNGISYINVNQTSNPLYFVSKNGSLTVFLLQSTSHDAPASGRAKLTMYYEIFSN